MRWLAQPWVWTPPAFRFSYLLFPVKKAGENNTFFGLTGPVTQIWFEEHRIRVLRNSVLSNMPRWLFITFKRLFVSPCSLDKHWIWKKNKGKKLLLIFLLHLPGIFYNIHTHKLLLLWARSELAVLNILWFVSRSSVFFGALDRQKNKQKNKHWR